VTGHREEDVTATAQYVTYEGSAAVVSESILGEFRSAMRGPVLTQNSDNYDEVRAIWNGLHDKRPGLIARCTGVADVITAVNFAREHNLLIAVRSDGHDVSGSGSCDGGIMIDFSLIRGVYVEPKERTARVQGGATWCDAELP
jgi:FAD/FMN-containing dehydrogenase